MIISYLLLIFKNLPFVNKTLPNPFTVHSSTFHVPGRISTGQGKQYSSITDHAHGTVRQMNDTILDEIHVLCGL